MTGRARRRAGLLATLVAGALAAVPAPAPAQVPGGHIRVGENYRLVSDPPSSRFSQAPGLAVNPADPNHLVAFVGQPRDDQCEYNVSLDGGRSWKGGRLTAPAGFPDAPCRRGNTGVGPTPERIDFHLPTDAGIAWGTGLNVYATFASPRPDRGDSIMVARSTDGGRTFATAVEAIAGGVSLAAGPRHKLPTLAVERAASGDRLYVAAWALTDNRINGATVVARSDDGGTTWQPSVTVSAPGERTLESSQPVIDRAGTVYLTYRTTTAPRPEGVVVLARSSDAGLTWQRLPVAEVRAYGPDPAGNVFSESTFPRLAIDGRTDDLYVVYGQGPNPSTARSDHFIHPDSDVLFTRSSDGGQTWSVPLRVNDDQPVGNGITQRHPNVSVAPGGRIDVVWQDRRHAYRAPTNAHEPADEARLGDTYYSFSTDGGRSFSPNRRITDRSMNNDVGLDHQFATYWDYGPVSVPVGDDEVLFAWMDSRDGNFEDDTQDVWLARLSHRAAGPLPVARVTGTPAGLSVEMSRLARPGGSEAVLAGTFITRAATSVVLVNENDAVGALAASVLSRAQLGPVLFTPASRLSAGVRSEIARLAPVGAYLVGDESQLSPGLLADLAAAGVPAAAVVRIAGSTPPDTARLVAQAMDSRGDIERTSRAPAFDAAVVVNPDTPEAAGAVALATARRLPILFTGRDALPAATRDALASLAITATLVVGGPDAVGAAVADSLPSPTRLGGATPTAVAESVGREQRARGVPVNVAYVVDAARPLDGAVVGAAAGRLGGLLVAVPGADPGAAEAAIGRMGLTGLVDRLVVAVSAPLDDTGYRLAAADGGVFAFGNAAFLGSAGALRLASPVVAAASTPGGAGYRLAAADGGVFAFGDARFLGSLGGRRLASPVVGTASTLSGQGYWLVAADGGVFAFGDAGFHGSAGAQRLAQPVVGMAPTPTGRGYWLVARDGGVFAFGDARFHGSTGATRLARPIVALVPTPSGQGYWLAGADGGVFAFGDARFLGSMGGRPLAQPVVAMSATVNGAGYWLVARDGGVFAFGDARFLGSMGGRRLSRPVVAIAR